MKSKKKESSILGNIISTVIYVLLILILAFSLFANFNKKENEITSFFGYAFAVVQSGSMVDGGFNVGDMVIIKSTNTDSLRRGDIVVFYMYHDDKDNEVATFLIDEDDLKNGTYVDPNLDDTALERHTKKDAINSGARLVFHRIIEIKADEYGVRFFETQGDSNNSADSYLIREDFICAKYLQSSPVLQSVFTFVASPLGLVSVVLIPIMLMVIAQFFSFGKELKGNLLASKLLERKIKYTEVDFEKYQVVSYLSPSEKVYLYDIAPSEDKPNMAIILFEEAVEEVLKIYEKDREEYYEYFSLEMGNKDKNKLELLQIKANIIKENPNISEEDANAKAKILFKEKLSNDD